MLVRSLIGARTQLLGIVTELSNQIRCLMRAGFARDACWSMTVPEASYHIDNLKKGRQQAG